mmetsp:Transcript_63543/g.125732  ORF Transcript_63543/g.125732 Transcript_63543/m.125732 type:complete len:214 (-) Transcript_63543:71-712(-)
MLRSNSGQSLESRLNDTSDPCSDGESNSSGCSSGNNGSLMQITANGQESTQRQQPQQDTTDSVTDQFPFLNIEANRRGLENALEQANNLFSKGSLDESVAWFSKAIWLVQRGLVSGVPVRFRATLHANRALAFLKQQKWLEAKMDCSAALALNEGNVKARYRRSLAFVEMGRQGEALQDIDQVIKQTPDPTTNMEAMKLRDRIVRLQRLSQPM